MLRKPLIYYNIFEEAAFFRHQNNRNRELKTTPFSNLNLSNPCVLLLDGLELLNSAHHWKEGDVNFYDGLLAALRSTPEHVIIVGVCTDVAGFPFKFQPAIQGNALFSKVIYQRLPNSNERRELLNFYLKSSIESNLLNNLSDATVGYSNRMLANFTQMLKMKNDLQFKMNQLSIEETNEFVWKQMKQMLCKNSPLHETHGFDTRKPNVEWNQIGGYSQLIKELKDLILRPFELGNDFNKFQIKLPSGVLLYGPSGCGKTFLINAIASNSSLNFVSAKCHQIYSKYLGESEERIRLLFQTCMKSRPCILFFDNIESIGTRREWDEGGTSGVQERILSTLLNEMDGVAELSGVIVIACTNRIDKLDDALKRPGRLDIHVNVPLPTTADRKEIFKLYEKMNIAEPELDWLIKETHNLTCADIASLVREAGILSLSEDSSEIQFNHIKSALGKIAL